MPLIKHAVPDIVSSFAIPRKLALKVTKTDRCWSEIIAMIVEFIVSS